MFEQGRPAVCDGGALMKANRDVTEALQRTIALMQKELERSVLSRQFLESSTATLRSAFTTHDTLDLILGTSKQLITALEKTDWLDRIFIISGLVVLFILKQRVIDRVLPIAFFWTRLLPGSWSNSHAVVQKTGEVVMTASASTAAASAVLASLISGKDGGASQLVEPSMEVSESPDFTKATMEPLARTSRLLTDLGDLHVEL